MELIKALSCIRAELERAERKFPKFPTDPVHAAAVVVEEAGELQKAALEFTYEDGSWTQMFDEAIHTGAMALRFLIHLDQMKERPSDQVERVSNVLSALERQVIIYGGEKRLRGYGTRTIYSAIKNNDA